MNRDWRWSKQRLQDQIGMQWNDHSTASMMMNGDPNVHHLSLLPIWMEVMHETCWGGLLMWMTRDRWWKLISITEVDNVSFLICFKSNIDFVNELTKLPLSQGAFPKILPQFGSVNLPVRFMGVSFFLSWTPVRLRVLNNMVRVRTRNQPAKGKNNNH